MSNEVARLDSDTLHTRMEYAKALAASNLLPTAYQKQPQNILVAMEYGDALGLLYERYSRIGEPGRTFRVK